MSDAATMHSEPAAGLGATERALQGHDVVCISSIDWDFIWQGHQEIMATFARQGSRVLFIDNTGVRAPGLRDLPRLKHRVINWWKSTKGFRQERENLFVYSPILLPFPYSRIARRINRMLLLNALERWMRAVGFRRPIIWTFLPTPLARDAIRALDPELVVYYCIDDLASSSPGARRISRSETCLFREADLVFVTSEKLRVRAAAVSNRVHVFPFGVDFATFERVRLSAAEVPEDLGRLPRPVVGYVGGIHQWVDQELMASVAARMPEVSFAFVGPTQTQVDVLARQPNVYLLGPRSHEQVPRYIKGFDVGVVPYRRSEYTAHVYPTKLNEYLAMGLPVVATNLAEVQRFNAEHGGLVAIAEDAAEFEAAIRRALASTFAGSIQRRIEVSQQNSWEARIAGMSSLIRRELESRRDGPVRWQASLRRLYQAARRRLIQTIAAAVVIAVVLFRSPFVWWVAEPLRLAEGARPADAVVVFAGGVGESGKAGGGYQERVKHAVDLYHAHYAPRLIFSSGYAFVFQEAEVMKALAVANQVPASAIMLEAQATNTRENVQYVHAILKAHGWRRILLVSSPYHMRRAVWTFHKAAPEIEVIPSPVKDSQFYAHGSGTSLEQLLGVVHEYVGLAYYWWKGWL